MIDTVSEAGGCRRPDVPDAGTESRLFPVCIQRYVLVVVNAVSAMPHTSMKIPTTVEIRSECCACLKAADLDPMHSIDPALSQPTDITP
jgi:hypothetical protein